MPKVTLLTSKWSNYTLSFGKADYFFKGNREVEVPTAVALYCKKIKKRDGSAMFKVDGLDNVVTLPTKQKEVIEAPRQITQRRLIEAESCH